MNAVLPFFASSATSLPSSLADEDLAAAAATPRLVQLQHTDLLFASRFAW